MNYWYLPRGYGKKSWYANYFQNKEKGKTKITHVIYDELTDFNKAYWENIKKYMENKECIKYSSAEESQG